jgi:two-component system response regulator RegX3
MRAVLRRAPFVDDLDVEDGEVITVDDVVVNTASHEVTVRGQLVALPLKEFELLTLLIENAGRVLTRGTLIDRIWGSDYVGDTKTLDVHIKRLRGRIEDDPSSPTRIVTVRGLGYKYVRP